MVETGMIPVSLSNKLESVQRQALRIIYGWNNDIDEIMAAKNIETLHERRKSAVKNFALKNEYKERYGKKWFRETPISERPRRQGTYNKYVVPFCRTERMRANPIVNMTVILNEHYSE